MNERKELSAEELTEVYGGTDREDHFKKPDEQDQKQYEFHFYTVK